ncbi:hypothetical protein ACFO0S_09805 [Chryseomicrobium palamuruense]|uniref:Uncharacterized protein n=1 Tax=Chryseomicrobium palamuruense TaxID=682973 RepID=A0ABV8UVI9_9BACL
MERISLIKLTQMIQQGEDAKREVERRFGIKWEDVRVVTKSGEKNHGTVSASETST